MVCHVEGTYTSVKGDDFVQYLIESGVPKDEAMKMKGTHWTMRLSFVGSNKILTQLECVEHPELNMLDTFEENVVKDIDHALMGGKAKLHYVRRGDSGYTTTLTSEAHGESITEETYTEEGLSTVTNNKKTGKVFKECWDRLLVEDGWYKCVGHENMEGYYKATNVPVEYVSALSSYRVFLATVGDREVMKETFDGLDEPIVHWYKMDEEWQYNAPPMPDCPLLSGKVIITQTGKGKYTLIFKRDRDGQREEWKYNFTENKCVLSCLDVKSGQSGKIILEKFVNIFGDFRPISCTGVAELQMALGTPADIANKLANEFDAKMSIKETHGMVNFTYNSKWQPMNVTYKWNEEYQLQVPGMPGQTWTCMDTVEGDTVIGVMKNAKCSITTKVKITDNFAIVTSRINGTNMQAKTLMERI